MPDFGTMLKTKIQTLRVVRTGQTELLPTTSNTLLIEAGCSAEKTRKLIKWLKAMLAIDPSMPVLFITTRKTHADDLAAALAHTKRSVRLRAGASRTTSTSGSRTPPRRKSFSRTQLVSS